MPILREIALPIMAVICFMIGISRIRMFHRSRIQGYFLLGFGSLLCSFGLLFIFLAGWRAFLWIYFSICLLTFTIGWLRLATYESGAWKELRSRNRYRNFLLGNVEGMVSSKHAPAFSKRFGILAGLLFILLGPLVYFLSSSRFYLLYLPILGIVVLVVSLVYGKRSQSG